MGRKPARNTRRPSDASGANDDLQRAEAAIKAGQPEAAVPLLRGVLRALGVHPQRGKVQKRLGEVLLATGRHDEAIAELEAALPLEPSIDLRYRLAQSLAFAGRGAEAMPLLEGILQDNPDHAQAHARLAVVCQYTGDPDRAISTLDDAYARGLGGVDLAHSFAMLASAHGRTGRAIDVVAPFTRDASLAPHVRADMCYRLGKLLDDEGEHARAWDAYTEGSRLAARPWDADAHDAKIDAIIRTLTPDTIASLAENESGGEGEPAILVVGMPRSGTTLIEQMIASHPEVESGGELQALPEAIDAIPGKREGDPLPPLNRVRGAALKKARRLYLDALRRVSPDAARVTDKLPFNYLHLGLVPALLPGASVVHCARHPCDTALSIYFRNFQAGHEWTTDLANIARYSRAYRRLMEHFSAALPEAAPELRFAEADYETLTDEPGPESRRILDAIGLPWDDACAAPAARGRLVPTLEPEQAGRGVYTTSKGRWRRYEPQLAPFLEAIGDAAED